MKTGSATESGPEQYPPDPIAAQALATHTRELLHQSSGLPAALAGLFYAGTGAILLHYPDESAEGILALAGVFLAQFAPDVVFFARARTGEVAVAPEGSLFGRSLRRPIKERAEVIGTILGVILVFASIALGLVWSVEAFDKVMGTIFLLLGSWSLFNGVRMRSWASVCFGACSAAAGVPLLSAPLNNGLAFLFLGLGFLIPGVVRHLRWRRWVASLPKEDAA